MSGWNNWGIRRKLFSIIVLLLALQVVILLFAGSYLFERFYTTSKTAEMRELAKNIRSAYDEDSVSFYDEIGTAEYENVVVTLYAFDEEGNPTTVYHSRAQRGDDAPWRDRPNMPPMPEGAPKEERISDELLQRLKAADSSFDVQVDIPQTDDKNRGKNNDKKGRFWEVPDGVITLVTKLNDNLYLDIFTPRGYIKSTADLAVKYTAFLSIVILFFGSVVIYFLVGRLTRPISRIQTVADKIAGLDFSQKCQEDSGDEIGLLGRSINRMSHELEAAIEKLVSANEVLKSDLERQQQTERIRRQFIADVSHDFKTPLTLVVSYAEALSEEREGRDKEYCDIIISEGNRLSAMVGKLLELSRLENGADPVEWSIFCLSEIVDEAIRHHRLLTEKKGLGVARELEDDFIVHADFQKIVRVVTNLFENAVKYTPQDGIITVRARRNGDLCRLEVENTGTPIPDEEQDRLFESFYRADKARESQGSFGIGLATVRAVMEAHGRAYGVENTEKGVLFWVELELAHFDDDLEDETELL